MPGCNQRPQDHRALGGLPLRCESIRRWRFALTQPDHASLPPPSRRSFGAAARRGTLGLLLVSVRRRGRRRSGAPRSAFSHDTVSCSSPGSAPQMLPSSAGLKYCRRRGSLRLRIRSTSNLPAPQSVPRPRPRRNWKQMFCSPAVALWSLVNRSAELRMSS